MLRNLTLNSIFWLVLGVLLFGYGAYNAYYWRDYIFSSGLIFLGLGSISCGLTNGFADYSPMGRMLWRFGLPFLLLGLLLTGYHVSKYI